MQASSHDHRDQPGSLRRFMSIDSERLHFRSRKPRPVCGIWRYREVPKRPALHQIFVIFAPFCADPLSCDSRKIFAQKIAKIAKIWDPENRCFMSNRCFDAGFPSRPSGSAWVFAPFHVHRFGKSGHVDRGFLGVEIQNSGQVARGRRDEHFRVFCHLMLSEATESLPLPYALTFSGH
jgi:hypothetical protein